MSPTSAPGDGAQARAIPAAGAEKESGAGTKRAQRQYLQRLVKYSTDPVLRKRAKVALEHIAV